MSRIANELNNEERRRTPFGFKLISVLKSIFIYVLSAAIIIAALLFAADNNPQKSIFGYRYYTVLTPSMEPEFSVGDVVIVKLANAEEIEVGDIITFNPSSETDAYLTHRVTQVLEDYEGTGVTCFRTKGDANDTEDSFTIDSGRLIGKVVTHVPKAGYIIRFVQLRWYFVIPLIIMIFIFFELLRMYLSPDEETETEGNSESEARNTRPPDRRRNEGRLTGENLSE